MESRTIALLDSTFWFMKVSIVIMLAVSTTAHPASGHPGAQTIQDATATTEVKLVKKLPARTATRRWRHLLPSVVSEQ